jgi:hypothetical protein
LPASPARALSGRGAIWRRRPAEVVRRAGLFGESLTRFHQSTGIAALDA